MLYVRLISEDDSDSNTRISREKVSAVEEYLSSAETTLFNLDYEITRLRSRLKDLVYQEQEIAAGATALKACIAPIRRVMPEILQEIFYHCIPTAHNAIMSSREAPLLLGRVCSYWRQLAFSTPILWSSLHICHSLLRWKGDIGPATTVIREWLNRSRALPLSISISDWEVYTQDIINVVMEFSPRWRRIYIDDGGLYCFDDLLLSVKVEDVPLLEEITLVEDGDYDEGELIMKSREKELVKESKSLLSAPLLRRISLPSFGHEGVHYPITPWEVLTGLDLCSGSYPYSLIRNILARCPRLETCSIMIESEFYWSGEDLDEPIDYPKDKIFLPHLHTLNIRPLSDSYISGVVNFFETLYAPQLRHLKIHQPSGELTGVAHSESNTIRNSDSLHALYSFFRTLEHGLEELCLEEWTECRFGTFVAIALLEHLPLLRRLSLSSLSSVHHPKHFDDSMLAMFTDKSTDDDDEYSIQCLCPHLEVLHITEANFKPSNLLSFLRSRTLLTPSSKFSRLRKVSISFLKGTKIPSEAIKKEIEKLERETGLIVDLWYYPEQSRKSKSCDDGLRRKKFSAYDGLGIKDIKCDWSMNASHGGEWTRFPVP